MRGKDYKGRGNSEDGKAVFDKPRPARKMLPPCDCKQSLKGKSLKCRQFSSENRQKIFDDFWTNLNWEQRKQFIRGLVDVLPTVKKKSEKLSRRSSSFVLNFKKDGLSHRVCKRMFLNTFGIGEWSLHNWTKTALNQSSTLNNGETIEPKTKQKAKEMMIRYFKNLLKMERHYCRSRSNKLYLEPIW